MSKNIYCIRHGIAEHNMNYLKYGSSTFYDPQFVDTSLVQEGFNQAKQLGETWKDIDTIELVIVSPLKRTLQTACEIFKDKQVPMIALEYVREFPLGKHTCNKRSSKDMLVAKYSHINFDSLQSNQDDIWMSHREETIEELNLRIQKLKEFIASRSETNIALVNHSSFIGQMKDQEIKYLDNGQEELKHCYPYLINL
jgi:broad specificity phosphatase PhoE